MAAALSSCGEEKADLVPSFSRYVEARSGLVLYAPRPFAVTATHATGLAAGFRLEDVPNETLAGIVQTTSRQADIRGSATAPFTSQTYAKTALEQYISKVKKNITLILPGSDPDEAAGDWAITTLRVDTTYDRQGQAVAYGHFSLQYAPVYQLRSYQVFQYLAAVILGINWTNFPANTEEYFAAGNSTIQFTIALATYEPQGFFGGDDGAEKVAVSISAFPGNKRAPSIADSLDDMLTFKTLGTIKDELVEREAVFEVAKGAPPIDAVFVLDRNGSMTEEAPRFRKELTEMITGLYKDGDYDLRIAFLTNDGPAFVRLKDGKPFLSTSSTDPEVLVRSVLDQIWATATGSVQNFVVNDLMRNAVLAVTDSTNPGFHRPEAPLLMFYLTDRDDSSPKLDGTALSSPAQYYAAELGQYDHLMIIAPQSDNCAGTDYAAQDVAANLAGIASRLGGYFQDLCAGDHYTYKREFKTWSEQAAASFRFEAPQPMAFTLRVSVNGGPIAGGATGGFSYDPLGDRLTFAPDVEPQGGDRVSAKYFVLETPKAPARK